MVVEEKIDMDLQLDAKKQSSAGQSILGLGKLKKRAQTLSAMGKNLTDGGENFLGDLSNLSKDAINKLQKKNIIEPDEEKEEDDWWLQPILALKMKRNIGSTFAKYGVARKEKKSILDFRIPKKYIISYKDHRKTKWDVLIMALAIYSGFIIPLDFGFSPYFLQEPLGQFLNILIDILFLADLIIGFFTNFINK